MFGPSPLRFQRLLRPLLPSANPSQHLHDTAEFAIDSILAWWKNLGRKAYPKATKLLIMADAGG
jgi:hypothetical protein